MFKKKNLFVTLPRVFAGLVIDAPKETHTLTQKLEVNSVHFPADCRGHAECLKSAHQPQNMEKKVTKTPNAKLVFISMIAGVNQNKIPT